MTRHEISGSGRLTVPRREGEAASSYSAVNEPNGYVRQLKAQIRELEALLDECERDLTRIHLATQNTSMTMRDVGKEVRALLDKLRAAQENADE